MIDCFGKNPTEPQVMVKCGKEKAMSKRYVPSKLFRMRLLIMIFINMCPIFHWVRNNRRILNFYYYICLAEFEKVKNKDSEVIDLLHRDLLDARDSFDKLYGLANFMNSREFRMLVAAAPDKK